MSRRVSRRWRTAKARVRARIHLWGVIFKALKTEEEFWVYFSLVANDDATVSQSISFSGLGSPI
jgi:hypothetical protein